MSYTVAQAIEAFTTLTNTAEDYHYYSLLWSDGTALWRCSLSLKIGHPRYKSQHGIYVYNIYADANFADPRAAVEAAIALLHARARAKLAVLNTWEKPSPSQTINKSSSDIDELARALGL